MLLLTLLVLATLLVLPLEVRPTVYTLLAVGRELNPRLLEGGCWLALLFAALWVDAGQRCVGLNDESARAQPGTLVPGGPHLRLLQQALFE